MAWTAICSSSCAACAFALPATATFRLYVIFHDRTLRELARLKPTNLEALRHVYGVGDRKVEELGEDIVATIRSHATG